MTAERCLFKKEGDYWTLAFNGPPFRLKDSKGLGYIERLLRAAGQEIHCLDLVSGGADPEAKRPAAEDGLAAAGDSDAGEVIDAPARAAYRARLTDLRAQLDEAEQFNDPERAARAASEIDSIEQQLAGAFGLSGRARRAGSNSERARVNVRNAIASAMKAVARHDPELGKHLTLAIRTGTYCSYVAADVTWHTTGSASPSPAEPSSSGSDRFLTTILFTDVVGSTERASELGDRRWRAILDQHDALTVAEIERCDGQVVKTFGDSFFASFASPAKAIRCALGISKALAAIDLQIRAGVHSGECERRGDDLGGIAVHIGARILALAAAGEVLVSSTVRDLVTGSDLHMDDRGFHELRGVPGTWRLFSVTSGAHTAVEDGRRSADAFAIMLVDDHPMWRETLRKVVEHSTAGVVVAEAGTGGEAIEMARAARPDVIVMDLNLPEMSGPEATTGILAELPETRVLMLSSSDEREDVRQAVRAGASGYLVKTAASSEVAEAIRKVRAGELVFPAGLADVVRAELRGQTAGSTPRRSR